MALGSQMLRVFIMSSPLHHFPPPPPTPVSGGFWARQRRIHHQEGNRYAQGCHWLCFRSPRWLGNSHFSWICRTWGVNHNVIRISSQLPLLNCRTSWKTNTSFEAQQQKTWSSLCDRDSLVAQMVESACNAQDPGLIPGSGRSSREGNDNRPQYSCLEKPMDEEAWQATVHGGAKSQTRLSDFTFFSVSVT